MRCDVINALYKENRYEVSITESEICYRLEELENLYGMVNLKLYNQEDKEIEKLSDTEWIKEGYVKVRYEFKEEYKEYEEHIEHVEWIGECDAANSNESVCVITTNEIKNATVSLELTINMDGVEIKNQVQKNILIDLQRPSVIDGSVNVNNELSTNNERRVEFEIRDGSGSGIKSYSIVKEKSCSGKEYEENKQIASDGVQSIYLGNGDYYICVEDKVGNKTSNEDLENSKNQIHVEGVDTSIPVISSFSVKSKESGYNDVDTILGITASDDGGVNGLEMCISNSGYLQGCSWEKYSTSKNWKVTGSLDGKERTVYLSIRDNAGNVVNREAKYTVYKDCSNQKKEYTESSYGTCSKSCGGGIQYRAYRMKDSKTGTICTTGKDSKTCNTQSCAPTVTRVGEYLTGLLNPLNSTQFVEFDHATDGSCNGDRSCGSSCSTKYCSWVSGRIINVNGTSISYGPEQQLTSSSEKYKGNGVGEISAVRIDDHTIAVAGGNRKTRTTSSNDYATMIIKTNGNNMWTSQNIGSSAFDAIRNSNGTDGLIGLSHVTGESIVRMYYDHSSSTSYQYCYIKYNYQTASVEGSKICTSYMDYSFDYSFDNEGRVGQKYARNKNDSYNRINVKELVSLTNETEVKLEENESRNTMTISTSNGDIEESSWEEYGLITDIQHFGSDKLVIRTYSSEKLASRVYNVYYIFYRLKNGEWIREHVVKAPGFGTSTPFDGEMIPLNETTLVINSKNYGLYVVEYN